jgi:glutathione peroxidase
MNTKLVVFAFMAAALMFSLTSFIMKEDKKTLYDFKAKTIDGKDFDFSSLKGKKVMIVNTASLCGFTPQYADLEKLYQQYGGEHFTIIGFPANNFGSQEPGSNTEIHQFCTKNYNVTFQMMEKISVKGDDMHPLYQWLTEKSENGMQDAPVQWNFQKFLIDENGNWAGVALSKESPLSERIVAWIKAGK